MSSKDLINACQEAERFVKDSIDHDILAKIAAVQEYLGWPGF
jgi:hypothetical protein